MIPTTDLPKLGSMPSFDANGLWINGSPRTEADLRGKVILVDFWTYSCINCIRTFPYLKDWWNKYKQYDYVQIGVHTPEFEFEKEEKNVRRAVSDFGLTYPIITDNEFVTWKNYTNRFWPATYIFDKEGQLRYTHFGEGNYDHTEKVIQELLGVTAPLSTGEQQDFAQIKTPETYFGYGRADRLASPETILRNASRAYSFPVELPLNLWALEGDWMIEKESVQFMGGTGKFRFHYSAGDVLLVMDTADRHQSFPTVTVDGKPVPADSLGKDVQTAEDGHTYFEIEYPKGVSLVSGPAGDHILELTVNRPGVKIFAITFGAKK